MPSKNKRKMFSKNKSNNKDKEGTRVYKTDELNKKAKVKPKKKTKTDDKTRVNNPELSSKEAKKNKKKKSKARKVIRVLIILFILGVLVAGGVFAGILYGMFGGDDLKITKDQLLIKESNSVVLDKDGNVIANLNWNENRKEITLDDMAAYLPVAFVSIEDERFYEHKGVDVKRTAGAIVTFVTHLGKSDFGGSTITQQLVKMITKEDERAWQRKVKEISRAYEVERLISKDQVLELYLNMAFLGDTAYGVEVASNYYFSKSAKDLTLAECAFLAGINHSPNYYKPFETYEDKEDKEQKLADMKAKIAKRTKTVLEKMHELGKILTEEEYTEAIAKVDAGLDFNEGKIAEVVFSSHTDAAILQILKQLQEDNDWSLEMAKKELYGGNNTIYTTQDSSIQARMQEEAQKDKYISASKENEGETTQAALTIIDPKTGYVVGSIGGTGPKDHAFSLNRATQQPKATGSSMKPIAVVSPGIESGVLTAGSVFDDYSTTWGGWTPKNYDWRYRGLTTVRTAIEVSDNIVNVKALVEVGTDNSMQFLQNLGISTLVPEDNSLPSLALGGLTHGVTTLEMAAAYAAIANDGVYIKPTFYTKVVDKDGNVILEPKQESRRVMSEAAAYVVKDILTQPVLSGTATYCKIPGMDVSAKTGTTDKDYDRWLCGFTNYYAAACWYGYDKNESVKFAGGNPAGTMWAAVMKDIHEPLENSKYEKPSNVTYATICKDSGLLAGSLCGQDPRGNRAYSEVFVAGTVPNKICDCHAQTKICNSTGKVANEYCPDTTDKVFITRKNSDLSSGWRGAEDARIYATNTNM